jgi:hypothetical protein
MSAQKHHWLAETSPLAAGCPFFEPAQTVCRAALLTFMPESRHLYSYCCSDDHDDCPLFLAKALRSSSIGSLSRDTAAHSEK